ncbi:hypothetical protein DsansV1_C06g0067611 [Dioscorea sansibarensis]
MLMGVRSCKLMLLPPGGNRESALIIMTECRAAAAEPASDSDLRLLCFCFLLLLLSLPALLKLINKSVAKSSLEKTQVLVKQKVRM